MIGAQPVAVRVPARMVQAAHQKERHQAFSITTQPAPVMDAGTW